MKLMDARTLLQLAEYPKLQMSWMFWRLLPHKLFRVSSPTILVPAGIVFSIIFESELFARYV